MDVLLCGVPDLVSMEPIPISQLLLLQKLQNHYHFFFLKKWNTRIIQSKLIRVLIGPIIRRQLTANFTRLVIAATAVATPPSPLTSLTDRRTTRLFFFIFFSLFWIDLECSTIRFGFLFFEQIWICEVRYFFIDDIWWVLDWRIWVLDRRIWVYDEWRWVFEDWWSRFVKIERDVGFDGQGRLCNKEDGKEINPMYFVGINLSGCNGIRWVHRIIFILSYQGAKHGKWLKIKPIPSDPGQQTHP